MEKYLAKRYNRTSHLISQQERSRNAKYNFVPGLSWENI
jgi:hypothetical protein